MGSKNKTNIVSKFELFVAKWLEVCGSIFAIVGLFVLIKFLIFYFMGISVTATITKIVPESYPYISYQTNKGIIECQRSYSSNSEKVGDKMTIYYFPQKPTHSVDNSSLVSTIFACTMGGLFIVSGVFAELRIKKGLSAIPSSPRITLFYKCKSIPLRKRDK